MKNFAVLAITLLTCAQGFADTSSKCPGEDGTFYVNYRQTPNQRAGGFVADTATIEDSTEIFIGPSAAVCGFAMIEDRAKISGNSIVRGNARVVGSSTITGNVVLEGDVVVSGTSIISGTGTLSAGAYESVKKILADFPAATSSSDGSVYETSKKLLDYASKHAYRLSPNDGAFYDSGDSLTQQLSLTGGGCQLIISKKRSSSSGKDSRSFYVDSKTSFSLSDIKSVMTKVHSPSLVSVSLLMTDKAARDALTKRSASCTECDLHDVRSGYGPGTHALYVIKNFDSTVESIETTSDVDANAISVLLNQLVKSCAR